MENIRENARNAMTATSEFVNNSISKAGDAVEGIRNTATQVTQNVQDTFENITSNNTSQTVSSTDGSFLSANSIITKIAFILLVVVVFLILFRFGVMIIGYMTSSTQNPYLIKGMISGNTKLTINRDSTKSSSVFLARSNNQTTGAEYTWSVWLNVNSLNETYDTSASNPNRFSHVFNVGGNQPDSNGIMTTSNAPGVYLTKYKVPGNNDSYGLSMRILVDTEPFKDYTQTTGDGFTQSLNKNSKTIDITQLPFNNWFHLAIRLENTVMDIYINGTIAGRINFETVPKQNYYDVNICQNGGFVGNLSDLRYFPKGLNIFDINSIVLAGPNTSSPTIIGSSTTLPNVSVNSNYDYISNSWYYSKM